MFKIILMLGVFLIPVISYAQEEVITEGQAASAVGVAAASLSDGTTPEPGPTPPSPDKKYPRKKCPYCKGTGFIVQGDGHRTECTHCEPEPAPDPFAAVKAELEAIKAGQAAQVEANEALKEELKKVREEVSKPQQPPKRGQCCQDCTCGDDCQCTYPGECLVNANGGEPVVICDGDQCRRYAPPGQQTQFDALPYPKFSNHGEAAWFAIKNASRAFAAGDYVTSARFVEMAHVATVAKPHSEMSPEELSQVKQVLARVKRARTMLAEKGVSADQVSIFHGAPDSKVAFDKAVYEKWKVDYAAYVDGVKKREEFYKKRRGDSQSCAWDMSDGCSSCSGGGMMSGGFGRFFGGGSRSCSSCGSGGCN